MNIVVQNALQEDIQIGEVLQVFVLVLHLVAQLGQLTKRAAAIIDAAIGNLKGKINPIEFKLVIIIYYYYLNIDFYYRTLILFIMI